MGFWNWLLEDGVKEYVDGWTSSCLCPLRYAA